MILATTRPLTDPATALPALPIVYTDTSAFFAAFPCPARAAERLLPHPDLKPVRLWPGAACLVVAIFDYRETTIGPYGEVGVGIMCRFRRSVAMPLVPVLREAALDDVGYWIVTLPVTTDAADAAGRRIWGYPKYVARIPIEERVPGRVAASVADARGTIMRVEIARPAASAPIQMPLRTYSKLGQELHLTEVAIDGFGAIRKTRIAASLTFEDHPRNELLGALPRRYTRPVEVRWFDQYRIALDRAKARYPISAL